MTKYALIENGIVTQIDCNERKGFIIVADNVTCGMREKNGEFFTPEQIDNRTYIEKRADAYIKIMPIGDQLDAILKGFNQLRFNGIPLPQDLDDILGKWTQIKKDNPKPGE